MLARPAGQFCGAGCGWSRVELEQGVVGDRTVRDRPRDVAVLAGPAGGATADVWSDALAVGGDALGRAADGLARLACVAVFAPAQPELRLHLVAAAAHRWGRTFRGLGVGCTTGAMDALRNAHDRPQSLGLVLLVLVLLVRRLLWRPRRHPLAACSTSHAAVRPLETRSIATYLV